MSLATQMFPDIQSLEFRQTRNGPDYDDATTGTAGWEDLNHLRTSFGESMMDDAWKLHRRVRWLDLTVIRWFRHGDHYGESEVLDTLATYSSQLRYLELVLISTTLSLGTELASWQVRGPAVCMVNSVYECYNARLRATGAATDIVDAIISSSSSIRYIGFTISTWLLNKYVDRYPPLSEDERETAMWWRVVDDAEPAGGRHPVHLYREQGERIRDYFHQADYDSPSWTDGLPA
ncbi:hypothetical protein A0H81_11501 [Grifola frondosa]|uniref:Uncharacterized protein n=1 Tax=Grifola frondosa TaxID=5627 RepID=A0A1C7LWT2_GRIFR|nr:hypothetical protein A0H81_11501 [Grifola frondosa]